LFRRNRFDSASYSLEITKHIVRLIECFGFGGDVGLDRYRGGAGALFLDDLRIHALRSRPSLHIEPIFEGLVGSALSAQALNDRLQLLEGA
jgi:hypothetical protein